MGARRGPGLRVLLRPALSVPAGERARLAHGRGGRRLHAGAPRCAGEVRRAGADRRRPHRRRGHGPHGQTPAGPLLARAVPPGGERAPVPWPGQLVADGGQIRLHPAELLPGAAGRDDHRAAVPLPPAPGRGGRRARHPALRRGRVLRCRAGGPGGGRGAGGLGADVAQLPAHAEAVPAVAAARARPAADRPVVRGHDGRLRPASPHRPRRGMAGPDGGGPIRLAA